MTSWAAFYLVRVNLDYLGRCLVSRINYSRRWRICVATTILINTGKAKYCWVTICRLSFVGSTTLVAGWKSITEHILAIDYEAGNRGSGIYQRRVSRDHNVAADCDSGSTRSGAGWAAENDPNRLASLGKSGFDLVRTDTGRLWDQQPEKLCTRAKSSQRQLGDGSSPFLQNKPQSIRRLNCEVSGCASTLSGWGILKTLLLKDLNMHFAGAVSLDNDSKAIEGTRRKTSQLRVRIVRDLVCRGRVT